MPLSFPAAARVLAATIAVGLAVPVARIHAAEGKADGPVQEQAAPRPKVGATLPRGAEEELHRGKPVNGLRAAIVIRPAPQKPKPGEMPDLALVVQNVSEAPIRLRDTAAAPKHHMLYLKVDGKTQLGIGAQESAPIDVLLQPREVAILPVFPPEPKNRDGQTTGEVVAEGTLKDAHQTMVVEVKVERPPAGAWSGKLVTRETGGAAAAIGGGKVFASRP